MGYSGEDVFLGVIVDINGFLVIFDRHANLKYKLGNRHFRSEGYYVRPVGLNEATIKKHIQDQEKSTIACRIN